MFRIDLYDSSGDYEASGIDGLEMHIHGNAQDQLGQIMKAGKLVVHGDVGQTFMYGAKGGEVYIRGNAAGRPLINAVGKPRVVINGTCLDYLAESFMAGNPLQGGGFVILNGLQFDDFGGYSPRKRPFPGSNLFSLASGGAIYIRDPEHKTVGEQLNGGHFHALADADWALIKPYLVENEKLFGIKLDDLLTHNGKKLLPAADFPQGRRDEARRGDQDHRRRRREPRDDRQRRQEEAQKGGGVAPLSVHHEAGTDSPSVPDETPKPRRHFRRGLFYLKASIRSLADLARLRAVACLRHFVRATFTTS